LTKQQAKAAVPEKQSVVSQKQSVVSHKQSVVFYQQTTNKTEFKEIKDREIAHRCLY